MPRLTSVAPNILLAPTVIEKAIKKTLNEVQEPNAKDAEVQTMYRESEAQTNPYTPDYTLRQGDLPEVLLLKDMTYENGLPLGKKEVEMIEHARLKKEIEMCLPPFTDEASLGLRKRMMEAQEMREFRLREHEMDAKREEKLRQLKQALEDRDESNEFLASQRVEAIRLSLTEQREKALEKIRNKRIKVLRRLARQRNLAEPQLSGDTGKDIINDYFDKGSKVYAPVKRDGNKVPADSENFDVSSRTAPLHNVNNLISLEQSLPKKLLSGESAKAGMTMQDMMSQTAPGKLIGVAQERLTSVAQRAIRNTKRDVEEMHQILLRKKHAAVGIKASTQDKGATPGTGTGAGAGAGTGAGVGGEERMGSPRTRRTSNPEIRRAAPVEAAHTGTGTGAGAGAGAGAANKKGPKRPSTPDITTNDHGEAHQENQPFFNAVMVLQRLIRGRAVQNVMYEGRYRRRELIAELRRADEIRSHEAHKSASEIATEGEISREKRIRESTIDAVAGGLASNFFQVRGDG